MMEKGRNVGEEERKDLSQLVHYEEPMPVNLLDKKLKSNYQKNAARFIEKKYYFVTIVTLQL